MGKLKHSCTSPICGFPSLLSLPRWGTVNLSSHRHCTQHWAGVAWSEPNQAGGGGGWELHLQAGMRAQAGTKRYEVTGRALEAAKEVMFLSQGLRHLSSQNPAHSSSSWGSQDAGKGMLQEQGCSDKDLPFSPQTP